MDDATPHPRTPFPGGDLTLAGLAGALFNAHDAGNKKNTVGLPRAAGTALTVAYKARSRCRNMTLASGRTDANDRDTDRKVVQ